MTSLTPRDFATPNPLRSAAPGIGRICLRSQDPASQGLLAYAMTVSVGSPGRRIDLFSGTVLMSYRPISHACIGCPIECSRTTCIPSACPDRTRSTSQRSLAGFDGRLNTAGKGSSARVAATADRRNVALIVDHSPDLLNRGNSGRFETGIAVATEHIHKETPVDPATANAGRSSNESNPGSKT